MTAESHSTCSGDQCGFNCVRDLCSHIADYIDEISLVMFSGERRDRKSWLSIFFSLYIQSYVRHALLVIETALNFPGADDPPWESLNSAQYLHIATILFAAVSAQYDPLFGNRRQLARTFGTLAPEGSMLERVHCTARDVCQVDKWSSQGIKTFYEFLRRVLQIGSLDFDEDDTSFPPTELFHGQADHSHVFPDLLSPFDGLGVLSADGNRNSVERSYHTSSQFAKDKRRKHLRRKSLASTYMNSNASSASVSTTLSTESIMSSQLHSPLTSSFSDYPSSKGSNHSPSLVSTPQVFPVAARLSGRPLTNGPPTGPLPQPPAAQSSMSTGSEIEASFVCDCCPKRPHRFRTVEELRYVQ
jgi:hypothetical protein